MCSLDPQTVEDQTSRQTAATANWTIIDECSLMNKNALDSCLVPNIVHFVWYTGKEFRLDHYFSMRSVYNAIKPDNIYVHGREFPHGNPHFDRAVKDLGLKTVLSREVKAVHRNNIEVLEHKSDIVRMESIIRFGGMYFDIDVLVIRPLLSRFEHIETALPAQGADHINNGIIISKRCSRFMLRWYAALSIYDDLCWGCASVLLPRQLSNRDSTGLVVDENKYIKSEYPASGDVLFSNNTSPEFWNSTIAIHTFIRGHSRFKGLTEAQILSLDNNYGRIIRNVVNNKTGF
jgi:hypothetical protein